MNSNKNSKELLSLMQLMSSNFPIGSFSYSKGIESAIELGLINSVKSFVDWQKQWIHGQLTYLDLPMLKRCYQCSKVNDVVGFKNCALKILSYRDTYELRLEERYRGKAISNLILQWYSFVDNGWVESFEFSGLAAIAWLGYMWNIPIRSLALGYSYNILESSIIVGLKLIPFGQKTAQQLLKYLVNFLPDSWDKANFVQDDELGNNFVLQSIASSCHEIQYSRLFRS